MTRREALSLWALGMVVGLSGAWLPIPLFGATIALGVLVSGMPIWLAALGIVEPLP